MVKLLFRMQIASNDYVVVVVYRTYAIICTVVGFLLGCRAVEYSELIECIELQVDFQAATSLVGLGLLPRHISGQCFQIRHGMRLGATEG
jgi:hypothetical protein